MRRFLLPLALALAAAPAAAQPGAPSPSFPGIAWGVDEDSVVRALGEPDDRRLISGGLLQLSYLDESDGRTRVRYILVHGSQGTMIAGYEAPFDSDGECQALALAALAEVEGAFPGLEWEVRRPEPPPLCAHELRSGDGDGIDAKSGTRFSIRLQNGALVADAVSAAGWELLGKEN
jgi:hypothetical protein